jgi:thymidine phosphorylase/8-oxo-dGTP pyrophosphatase MutT (NUDIX family)
MRAFLRHCIEDGLTPEETTALAIALARTGGMLDWQTTACQGKTAVLLVATGGIHRKTSLLAPLLALAAAPEQVFVPALAVHRHGVEMLEMLASIGYQTDWPLAAYQTLVARVGISHGPSTCDLVPVASRLLALRQEVGAVHQPHLVVSNVLGQALALGCRHMVVDVQVGPETTFGDLNQALAGVHLFLDVGQRLRARGKMDGMQVVLTQHDTLQGRAHGRLLALQESVEVLQGKGPQALTQLSVGCAARMLVTVGVCRSLQDAEGMVWAALQQGQAYATCVAYLEAHGADLRRLRQRARYQIPVHAVAAGTIRHVDSTLIDRLSQQLQAARGAQDTAGIVVGERASVGTALLPGDLLATVYTEDKAGGEQVAARLPDAFALYCGGLEVTPQPLILAEGWLEGDVIREVTTWQRRSQAALGIISRERQGTRAYLCCYNRKWGSWNMLAGHYEPDRDGDFQDTMVREFIEEVGSEIHEISPVLGEDFTVAPLTPPTLIDLAFSGSTRQWTQYELHLFQIILHGDEARWEALWQRHPETFRWFTRTELAAGISDDGQAILTPFPIGTLLAVMR